MVWFDRGLMWKEHKKWIREGEEAVGGRIGVRGGGVGGWRMGGSREVTEGSGEDDIGYS